MKYAETAYLETVFTDEYALFAERMEDQFIRQLGICDLQLEVKNIDEPGRTIKIEFLMPAQ